jgi:hypothetical protein
MIKISPERQGGLFMSRHSLFLRYSLLLLVLAGLVLAAACNIPKDEEIKSWMQIVDVETKWVSKEYRAWPPKLTLVPAISFRVKNVSPKPLTYINFNAIFKFKDDEENLGDNYLAGIRGTPVPPGELSPVILMKSNFGVEGKSLASFQNNPMWKQVAVKLFAQTQGSSHVLLGTYTCSRTIDFKEPEPAAKPAPKK